MIIVLIGSPGSGKGTQGNILAKRLNIPCVSIGDIFRQMVASKDPIGLSLKGYMDQGKLVPSELVNKTVQDFLSEDVNQKGCILDGYPRNLEQAKFLSELSNQSKKIIFFDIEDELVLQRIAGRFSCTQCGQIYNSYSVRPKIDDICDICGASSFTQRKDDNIETVKKRLEEYKIETQPMIEYYKVNDEFYSIDANKSTSQVEESITKALKMI